MFILSIGTSTHIQIYSKSHRCVSQTKPSNFESSSIFTLKVMFLPADVVLCPCPNFSLKFKDTNDIIPSKDVALGSNFEILALSKQKKDHLGSSIFQRVYI